MIAWLRGQDLNLGPLGYEPNELPDCSTPRYLRNYRDRAIMSQANAPLKQQFAKVSCVIKRFAASMLWVMGMIFFVRADCEKLKELRCSDANGNSIEDSDAFC